MSGTGGLSGLFRSEPEDKSPVPDVRLCEHVDALQPVT